MDTPQWDDITENIVIGCFPKNPEALRNIQKNSKVTAILCLQSDEDLNKYGIDWFDLQKYGEENKLTMKRIPMRDFDLEDQRRVLGEAVYGLATLIEDGHRVYIHSSQGINRAPLLVLSYLTFCSGMSLEDASLLLVTQRLHAAPPIEVWRAVRLDLLGHREDELEALAQSLASEPAPEDGLAAEAERRLLRSLFLSTAKQQISHHE
jgi:hypothetical protein